MRILWSIHLYPPKHNCGSEMMAHQISKSLVKKGHDVRVLLHQGGQYGIKWAYEHEGITVFAPANQEALFKTSDIICTHLEYTDYTIRMGRGKKIVHFVHNSSPYPPVIANPHVWVVYNSEWIKKALNYPNKSFVLRPPVDYRYYDVGETGEFITLINLDFNKGGGILTRIAEALPDKKFLAVKGSYSVDDKGQYDRQPPNVTVIENTPDILSVYKKTRVLIMPSLYESWGRTATEAMCSAIPVVCSRTEGLNENCGKAGLYVDDRDNIDQWVRWIKRLDDKKFYNQVSHFSRERSRELDPLKALDDFENWLCE